MSIIYENTDFIPLSVNKHSSCKDNPTVQHKREATPSNGRKTPLIALCVSVVLLIGGLCVLGVLYHQKLADFESVKEQRDMILSELSAQEENITIMKRNLEELTSNLSTVSNQLSLYEALQIQLHEFKAKYNRLKSSTYDSQFCNLPAVDGWITCRGMFYFSTVKKDWSSSRDTCLLKEADLVTITKQSEQDFLVSKIQETHWIGLNDLEREDHWVWVNNQTLKETGEQFWYRREKGKDEPDNWKVKDPIGENCASLGDTNGNLHTWFDGSCKEQKRFICEKKY